VAIRVAKVPTQSREFSSLHAASRPESKVCEAAPRQREFQVYKTLQIKLPQRGENLIGVR
jgi:hypothetical protein